MSVEFFYSWQKALTATPRWSEFLKSPTRAICKELKTTANTFEFTIEQINVLDQALLLMPNADCFSVRYSSPEEDLENISYAGMYETILGVSKEGLRNNIKKEFASMLDYVCRI